VAAQRVAPQAAAARAGEGLIRTRLHAGRPEGSAWSRASAQGKGARWFRMAQADAASMTFPPSVASRRRRSPIPPPAPRRAGCALPSPDARWQADSSPRPITNAPSRAPVACLIRAAAMRPLSVAGTRSSTMLLAKGESSSVWLARPCRWVPAKYRADSQGFRWSSASATMRTPRFWGDQRHHSRRRR
jgi:hypothetical protein